eukprot:m.33635 g.33635  ORF g.33635 m.33635 type:complete len:93 (-) comp43163_c0_seq2:57-335(-)
MASESAKTGAAAATGMVVTAGAVAGTKIGIAAALPTLMSATGTVVSGVGTIQAGFIGPLASFAATPVGLPIVLVGGCVAGSAYVAYKYSSGR